MSAPQGPSDPETTTATTEEVAQEDAPGEAMTRKLVSDVAAYEVDPPPPARARDAG